MHNGYGGRTAVGCAPPFHLRGKLHGDQRPKTSDLLHLKVPDTINIKGDSYGSFGDQFEQYDQQADTGRNVDVQCEHS